MSQPLTRSGLAPRGVAVLTLCLALLLAAAVPAAATTRKQATKKALSALGSKNGNGSVIVFGLKKPLNPGARITQGRTKKSSRFVMKVGRERAFFYYEDSGPFQVYPHRGRVALVGAKSGKVRLSKSIKWPPRINGKLPPFLKNAKRYRSPEYHVYYRTTNADAQDPNAPGTPGSNNGNGNAAPKADNQDVIAKQDRPRDITLTGSDDDGDSILFAVTKQPLHGTLSGAPPYVTYTPNPGYLGPDDFRFRTYDDVSSSNLAKVSIQVVPLGLPPVVTTSAGCTAYTQQSAAVVVDGSITVSDPDDTKLASATVRISAATFQEGDDLLFTDQNGISGSYDDTIGVLTLSGTSSVANYQAALRTVRYRNLSTNNASATKDVQFTVNDAGSDSAPATKQVCLSEGSGNSRPVAGTSEGALQYTENDGPVPVDSEFTLIDPDSANLTGATVKFVPSQQSSDDELGGGPPGPPVFNYFPGQDQLAFTDQNGITGSWNAFTGELTLSGTSSVANYEAAIRSVTYENTSEDPSAEPRTIQFQVTDSSGSTSVPRTRDIIVTPVNDAPVVTTSDGSTSYTEGDPATTVDSGVTAGDVDNTSLTGGQVRITSGFQSADELVFVDQNGITGSYDADNGILTLSGTASVADYQTALQSIQYRHTGDNPSTSKTVEFVVNDGELDSAAATRDIAVTPVNDKPVLSQTDAALSYTENAGAVAVAPGITASDVDSATFSGATVQISSNYSASEDTLGFADQNGISGSYDGDTGTLTLSGTASVADYQTALQSVTYENTSDNPSTATRTVSFQVDDGASSDNLSDPVTRDIDVTPVNDAPAVTTSDGSTSYTIGDTSGQPVDAAVAVADVDDTNIESAQVRISSGFEAGDELVYVNQLGISGVYNTGDGTLTLTGSVSVADYQTALQSIKYRHTGDPPTGPKTVEFVVNDGDADSNAATKTIDVVSPNDPPVVTTSGGSTQYGSGDPAVAVDSGVTVTDANDTNLESARVTISSGYTGGDELLFTDQNGITGSFDSDNGILNLSGTASVADYQTALQSVTFHDNGTNATTSRTIQFVVNDGDADSNTATKTIDIGPPTF